MSTLETSSDCAQSALAYLAEAQDETTHLRPVGKQPRPKHADQCVIFLNLAMHSPQSLLACVSGFDDTAAWTRGLGNRTFYALPVRLWLK